MFNSINPFGSKKQPTVAATYTQKHSKVSNILPRVPNIFGSTNSSMKNNASLTSLDITNYSNRNSVNLNSEAITIGGPNKSRVQNVFTGISANATQRKMNSRRNQSKVSNILSKVGGTRKNYRKKSRKNRKQSRKIYRK